MIARLVSVVLLAVCSGPVWASDASDELLRALGIDEIIDVMRDEGLDYGAEMALDFLPGGATQAWSEIVSQLYNTDSMYQTVREGFADGLEGSDLTPLIAFFKAEEGQRIVALEVSARRAMIDGDVEEAARDVFRDLDGTDNPQVARVEPFVAANDLIEANVAGAMNASYKFYSGLVDGGALELSEDEIFADVWSQEEETRADTREWLYGFLMLAYGPLEDEVVDSYVALSSTPEGKAMNRALFAGFNTMYDDLSYALGLAAAHQMRGEDL
ncbi:DUF2059 domain-containing protein [Puniceibacterium sp. IMCC21224]|uniref:DUF2059 domain-containing protein n=1 Tax=Puniceibacterium sp. IMCC21224 TaxID=1618204 RepID=UPI00064D8990|nr:DUF2059 domain-containing protein [Puniceibacterium sp. IMCC21224]KMK66846.1 hypothetical protein IMCC21224_111704 [Puniceibacterium sp. IMCC21224]